MKFLLIQPNYRNVYSYAGSKEMTPIFPPLGLAYIAALLRENGVEAKILEANAFDLGYEQIKQAIIKDNPEFIGLTATTCLIQEASRIAKIAKECSNAKIIVGGIHASCMPQKTLEEFPDIDIIVRGEGEYIILDIAQGKPLNEIWGVSYRDGDKIINNPERGVIEDLNKLPFPARDLLPMRKYFSAGARRRPSDYILSSRGCPYSCIFCADYLVHGKRFRARSPENVVAEIEMLIEKYGIREFDFVDDNFTLLPERVEKICDMLIEKGINKRVVWRCSNGVRIDRLSPALLKRMKKAGCYMLSLGIESGDEKILENIKKGITLDGVRKTVQWCKAVGIETRGLFMLGNLGENEETMNRTIEFAKSLDLDTATFHITVPFPMTEYWNIIEKEGKIFANKWQDYIAYGRVTFQHGCLTPKLLLKMQKRAYKEFYMRPFFIIKRIKDLRYPHNIKGYFSSFISLLRMHG